MKFMQIDNKDVRITNHAFFKGYDNNVMTVVLGAARIMGRYIDVFKIVTEAYCYSFPIGIWISGYTFETLVRKLREGEYNGWVQVPNYELIIETNSYTGNFERELVGYALGILDKVQMDLGDFHGKYEMNLFWQEEYGKRIPYPFYSEVHRYLMETWQDVDDWVQMTFYHMCDNSNSLTIQLAKPFDEKWEEIVIRRIKKFFEVHPCKYDFTLPEDAKLLDLYLVDCTNGNRIKSYM